MKMTCTTRSRRQAITLASSVLAVAGMLSGSLPADARGGGGGSGGGAGNAGGGGGFGGGFNGGGAGHNDRIMGGGRNGFGRGVGGIAGPPAGNFGNGYSATFRNSHDNEGPYFPSRGYGSDIWCVRHGGPSCPPRYGYGRPYGGW